MTIGINIDGKKKTMYSIKELLEYIPENIPIEKTSIGVDMGTIRETRNEKGELIIQYIAK